MNRDKQIEEMAKAVCHLDRTCDECMTNFECKAMVYAKRFYEAGYRKASEVASEVINKALSKIQIMISSIEQHEQTNIITEFNGGAKTSLKIVFKDLAELKKKYTEEGK